MHPRSRLRTLTLPAASVAALVLATLSAAPADAKIVEVGGVKAGVQTRNAARLGELGANPRTLENEVGGKTGPVVHSANTYGVYWDPKDIYDGDWQQIIDTFFAQLSESNGVGSAFSVDAQYRDGSNQPATTRSSFHGTYTDTNAYPLGECTDPRPFSPGAVTCLTDAQVRAQLETFVAEHNLPKGMGTIYFLMTPPGVTICLDAGGASGHCSDHEGGIAETTGAEAANESYRHSFCSYHAAITPTNPETGDANTILYAMIPWSAGSLGVGDLQPQLRAHDCQDGGFDPSSKPAPEEKEHANEAPRKAAEAKHRKEKEELSQKCRQRIKEVEANPLEKEEVEKNCEAELAQLETSYAEEIAAIRKKEEQEGPRTQQPHQAGTGYDTDFDYDQGLADVLIGQIALEQQNVVTDPLLNAWRDSANYEVADECRNLFWTGQLSGSAAAAEFTEAGKMTNESVGGGQYYLQDTFLLGGAKLDYPAGVTLTCMGGIDLAASFTAPGIVNAGEIVGFDGMESAVSLNWAGLGLSAPGQTYATYTWNFGDGTPEVTGFAPGAPGAPGPPCAEPWLSPCAASVFHSYQYGGRYEVTLTIKDTGGNVTSTVHTITVNGPAKPSTGGGGGGGGGGGSAGSGGAGAGAAGGAAGTGGNSGGLSGYAAPTATAAAASGSLRAAIRRGLMIRYSVNEQVAGTIEVLLNASTARRLHIRGPLATGLPSGYPSSVVIGRAVLVTRKGGSGAVRLKLSKATTRALRRVHRVSLTLRVVVRNASRTNPASTSLLSTFILHR